MTARNILLSRSFFGGRNISRAWIGCGGIVLLGFYLYDYFHNLALPRYPYFDDRGWWTWSDQSQYLASAASLVWGDFSPARHWYPLGYSILATPFIRLMPAHPFFLVDVFSLFGTYAGYLVVADRLKVQLIFSVPIFVATTFGDPRIGAVWVEPWNTTLSAALIWGALGFAADFLSRQAARPPQPINVVLFGCTIGCMPLVRPTDALLASVVLVAVGFTFYLNGWLKPRTLFEVALGLGIVCVPYGILYLHIYGLHLTPYMLAERGMGFALTWIGWKVYVIVISPRPWYPTGVSMLARFPWLILSFSGMMLSLAKANWNRDAAIRGLIALLVIVCWLTFITYIDTLPTSLWRYNNIHYFKWTFPALGLFALWQAEWLISKTTIAPALFWLFVIGGLSMIHLVAIPAKEDGRAVMVQVPGIRLAWEPAYFGQWSFSDAKGPMTEPLSVRVIPDSQGVRLLPQRRAYSGKLLWTNSPAGETAPPIFWNDKIRLRYPCWLPPYGCDSAGPGA